jgi:hypothetical protein
MPRGAGGANAKRSLAGWEGCFQAPNHLDSTAKSQTGRGGNAEIAKGRPLVFSK